MKLRIQGNSLRFRLNRREVSEFADRGGVTASVEFPGGGTFSYSIATGKEALVDARFEAGCVSIRVAERSVAEWARTDQVGVSGRCPLEGGGELEILIEKDFQCLHKGDACKDPEAYPNPMAATGA